MCAEFQFDLDTGSVSAHDCPKPFVEPSNVLQALPEIPVPDDCPDFGFLSSDLSDEAAGNLSEGDIAKICKILEFSAKSDIPEGCLPSIPPGFKALTLGNLLPVVPKCHF